jgi:hypothetical protein
MAEASPRIKRGAKKMPPGRGARGAANPQGVNSLELEEQAYEAAAPAVAVIAAFHVDGEIRREEVVDAAYGAEAYLEFARGTAIPTPV